MAELYDVPPIIAAIRDYDDEEELPIVGGHVRPQTSD